MEFIKEIQGAYSYLTHIIEKDEEIDELSMGMLVNNEFSGLLPVVYVQMDNTGILKYNISSKITANELLTGVVNKKRLLGVFGGIADAFTSADEYMLEYDSIILDLEKIYADAGSYSAQLICLPVSKTGDSSEKTDIGQFLKNIMFSTQFDRTENGGYVTEIINYLNGSANFNIYDFKKLITRLKNDNGMQRNMASPAQNTGMQGQNAWERQNPQIWQAGKTDAQPGFYQSGEQQPGMQNGFQQHTAPSPQPYAQQINGGQFANRYESGKNDGCNVQNEVDAPRSNGLPQTNAQPNPENKMTMLNLLMHYSKENKELYKQQKQARSQKTTEKENAESKKEKKDKGKKQKKRSQNFNVPNNAKGQSSSFSIPGGLDFAIPNGANQGDSSGRNFEHAHQRKPENDFSAGQNYQAGQNAGRAGEQGEINTAISGEPIIQPKTEYEQAYADFGDTTVIGASESGTVILNANGGAKELVLAHIVRKKNNEKIPVNKERFRIGKARKYADYCIGDNMAVSRNHAEIVKSDNRYFIIDLNSTNHTYVNGSMIPGGKETEIHHGDKIILANEEFEFRER